MCLSPTLWAPTGEAGHPSLPCTLLPAGGWSILSKSSLDVLWGCGVTGSVWGQDFYKKPSLIWSTTVLSLWVSLGAMGVSIVLSSPTLRWYVLHFSPQRACMFFKVYFQVLYLFYISFFFVF